MTQFLKKEEGMKTAITIVAMLVLAVVSGCQSSSPRGGMSRDSGSKIAVTTSSVEVKKGEIKPVTSALSTAEACSCNRPAP